jgi:hypothetical protein
LSRVFADQLLEDHMVFEIFSSIIILLELSQIFSRLAMVYYRIYRSPVRTSQKCWPFTCMGHVRIKRKLGHNCNRNTRD